MMMNAAALLSMLPLCRVQTLPFCPRILTRLLSAKDHRLRRRAHPISPEISPPPRQAPRPIRRCMSLHPAKALCNPTYCTLSHVTLP